MGSGPQIADQDGLELGPDLGPGQWPPCARISSSPSSPFNLQFLDCLGLQANKWKRWLETYLWELGSETGCCHHLAACNWQFCLKTTVLRPPSRLSPSSKPADPSRAPQSPFSPPCRPGLAPPCLPPNLSIFLP